MTWFDIDVKRVTANRPTARVSVTCFGVTFAYSRYFDAPIQPPSGAQIGVERSLWIYTRRRAFGFGRVFDWARLQYIEVQAAGFPPINTELGSFMLRPPPRFELSDQIPLKINNRNIVPASGVVRLEGIARGWITNTRTSDVSVLFERCFYVDALDQTAPTVSAIDFQGVVPLEHGFDISALFERRFYVVAIDKVTINTEHTAGTRFAKIHGRPEWEDG